MHVNKGLLERELLVWAAGRRLSPEGELRGRD